MARKTREGAAATREALLDAAETVFRTKGVAQATLADVAHAAGVTRGAVYWHFTDKDALIHLQSERTKTTEPSGMRPCFPSHAAMSAT